MDKEAGMGEEAAVLYRQRPLTVTAIRWEPALGAVQGVRARPKKHQANPDEYYVRDRFGKETLIEPGQWVLTYPDGSNAIVADGTFQALYEQDVKEPKGNPQPEGGQAEPAGAGGDKGTPDVGGVETGVSEAPGGAQVANPVPES